MSVKKKKKELTKKQILYLHYSHSLMTMYNASIVCNEKNTVGEFFKKNRDILNLIFLDVLNTMNYKLTDEDLMKVCVLYLQSRYYSIKLTDKKMGNE